MSAPARPTKARRQAESKVGATDLAENKAPRTRGFFVMSRAASGKQRTVSPDFSARMPATRPPSSGRACFRANACSRLFHVMHMEQQRPFAVAAHVPITTRSASCATIAFMPLPFGRQKPLKS